jgi:hypothetical protein
MNSRGTPPHARRSRTLTCLSLVTVSLACLTGLGALALYAGVLRRSPVPAARPTEGREFVFAEDTTDFRDDQDQIHYGLWFNVPSEAPTSEMRRGCIWTVASKSHGPLNTWELIPTPLLDGRRTRIQMLIPRTWLIRNGFLNPLAACFPTHEFSVWNRDTLMRGFWLEFPPHQNTPAGTQAVPE